MNSQTTCNCLVLHEEAVKIARSQMLPESTVQNLGDFFKVLGDPTRLKILTLLSSQELCVCDIAHILGMAQSAVSHQLKVLKQNRLVRSRRDGKVMFYALDDDHVEGLLKMGISHLSHD